MVWLDFNDDKKVCPDMRGSHRCTLAGAAAKRQKSRIVIWQNKNLKIIFSQSAPMTGLNSHTRPSNVSAAKYGWMCETSQCAAGGLREEGGSEAASKKISILQSN